MLVFSVHVVFGIPMSVVLILVIDYVLKYGLLIFSVVDAYADCCFSCAFCTVDYECMCVRVYTHTYMMWSKK